MRHRKLIDHVNQITAIPSYLDKSERFVMYKCASYVTRLLTVCPLADSETIEFIAWILGPDTTPLWKRFINGLSTKEKERYIFEKEIDLDDLKGIPQSMHIVLSNANKKMVEAFVNDSLHALLTRQTALSYKGQSDIEKRIQSLSKMFSLSENEITLVEFIYIISAWKQAENYFVDFMNCQKISGRRYLKTILQMNDREIAASLAGTLARIDSYELDNCTFRYKDEFIEFFQKPTNEPPAKYYFKRFSRKTIPLDNHMIQPAVTENIVNLLRFKRESSTHILLYGAPGTGKTSYALGLAKKLGIPAYEICQDRLNHTLNRRAAILACMNMTNGNDGSLIIVDEADNLLNTMGSWFSRGETQDKGWLNQLMEESGVRMIWITNDITSIEPSVMRRFAFSVSFPDFNLHQRISLWNSILQRHHVRRYFNDGEIKKLAVRYPLSAAIIDMAVVKALETAFRKSKNLLPIVEMNLNAHQILLNNGEKPKNNETIEDSYSIDGLNIKGNLTTIFEQLEAFDRRLRQNEHRYVRNFNLLFYGPPGTGKSELARFIAAYLDRELMIKRASDIISKYVGETEQNISRVFSQAETAEAVLVIDEADSFLFNRNHAIRSWEISQTNEFLTQMERFRGTLICTTNRFEGLDQASIRRFNYKIGFGCLKPEGNVIFYKKLLAPLVLQCLNENDENRLRNIHNLAPGDFRVVRDRFAILAPEKINDAEMIDALQEEAQIKKLQEGINSIGFR